MIISVVLNVEYGQPQDRFKWFLKSASFATEFDCMIITHGCIKEMLGDLLNSLNDRFYDEFEMKKLSVEDIENLNICYIPDSIFEKNYRDAGCQTKALFKLYRERNYALEEYIADHINIELSKRDEKKVDYIMNALHTFASIKYLAERYNCPLILYVFSALRKVHGYRQTLYMAHMNEDLFASNGCMKLYEKYKKENSLCVLNKKEILALLGKKRNLPLLPVMDIEGEYEMGIAPEALSIVPSTFLENRVTGDDIYFETYRYYDKDGVVTRVHPDYLDRVGIGRKHMKNDPSQFILSCKRVSSAGSLIMMKVALWNRVPCVLGNGLPYYFLFSRDFTSQNSIDDSDLNFILFGYFVPDSLMFDPAYWQWRRTNPSVASIMERHTKEILENLGYSVDVLNSENRLYEILRGRGCSSREIEDAIGNVKKDEIVFHCLSSRFDIIGEDGKLERFYVLNRKGYVYKEKYLISSHIKIETEQEKSRVGAFLLDDMDGFVSVFDVVVNGVHLQADHKQRYWAKGVSEYEFEARAEDGILEIEILWDYTAIDEYLSVAR